MTLTLALRFGSVKAPAAPPPSDDTTPDAFSFEAVTDATPSTQYASNVVTITGINVEVAVTVTGGEYRKNGGSWTSAAGVAVAGDEFEVRGTSSADYEADASVVLNVGTGSGSFLMTTEESPGGPVSDIISLTVMDATPLDATGDYGDATARTGVNGNGWVGCVVMPYLVAQTLDPSDIVLEVLDPGYDATGTTNVTRMIRGTEVLRRQYNAATSKQQSDNGVNITVYFALSDFIYQGSTIVSASAEAGYYGSAAAGSVTSITNSSTKPYYKPLVAWLNMPHEKCGAGGLYVEMAAAHRYGRDGRMVARIEFIGHDDPGNVAATQTASSTALSTIQTQGNIAEVYSATIPVTNLGQGELCWVNAKVYPWIGDSSAVLDLVADGFTWPTANPQTPLWFWNDKTGATTGVKAFVRAGASGGTASKTEATARAAPFPTLATAIAACVTANGGVHSGSTIYLMDNGSGGAVAHTIAAGISATAGECWTDVRKDPLSSGAVSISLTATRSMPDLMRFFVDINHTAGNGFDGGSTNNNKRIAFGGGTINCTGGAATSYRNGLVYLANITVNATADLAMMSGANTTRNQTALALGVIAEAATSDGKVLPFAMIGCRLKRFALQEQNPATVTSWDDQDGMFVYNTWFRDVRSFGTISALNNFREYERGLALIQSLFEASGWNGSSGQTALRLGGDNQVQPCDNILVHYPTFVGGRLNYAYADAAGAVGVAKQVHLFAPLGNDTLNIKTDTFITTTTARGRVGNWPSRYHVGDEGIVFASGSASGSAIAADGSTWLGEWADASNRFNVGIANIHFTDDQSTPIGNGALNGTYSLTGSTNAAYDAVPAGSAKLSYDIAGTARKNDGTGAAGCYERTA